MKSELVQLLKENLQQKFDNIEREIGQTQKSANEETKSSAGDKYETGRAMAQNEIEKLQFVKKQVQNDLRILDQMDFGAKETICNGALLTTNIGKILVGVSIGNLDWHGQKIMTASITSPLIYSLKMSKIGDKVDFRGQKIDILGIE